MGYYNNPNDPYGFNRSSRIGNERVNDALDRDGRTALHIAAEKGSIETVRQLLKIKADPNIKNDKGQTPLYAAIRNRDIEMIKLLLKNKADFRKEDESGQTPLMFAMSQKTCDICFLEDLRDAGIPFNEKDKMKRSVLHFAAMCNRADFIEHFIQFGADVSVVDKKGRTPLHLAAENKAKEALHILLEYGADVTKRDADIKTVLHSAVLSGDEEIVDFLLSDRPIKQSLNEFKTYSEGFTPLMLAVSKNHISIADKLIKCGADLTQKDNLGRNSLYIAVEEGHVEMAQLLLRHGADVKKEVLLDREKTPLLHKININHVFDDMLLLLHKAGADLNVVDRDGQSLVHKAVTEGHKDKLEKILSLGVNPNTPDRFGRSPLDVVLRFSMYRDGVDLVRLLLDHGARPLPSLFPKIRTNAFHRAINMGEVDVVKVFLEYNIDLNERDKDGNTPYLLSLGLGLDNFKISELLLKAGADPTKRNKRGQSALHIVAKRGDEGLLTGLLKEAKWGSQIDIVDNQGRTPLHYACASNNPRAIKLLIEAGADPLICDKDGFSAIHHVVADARVELLDLLEKTSRAPIDWNLKNPKTGMALLHVAAKVGFKEMVVHLLRKGADPLVKTKEGHTALWVSALSNETDVFKTFLKLFTRQGHHPDKDLNKEGLSLLHVAVKNNNSSMVEALLDVGANIDKKSKIGEAPIHLATRNCEFGMIDCLVKRGANINLKTGSGETALHIAIRAEQPFVVDSIVECGADLYIKTKDGLTPLELAKALNNGKDVYNTLLEAIEKKKKDASVSPVLKNKKPPQP